MKKSLLILFTIIFTLVAFLYLSGFWGIKTTKLINHKVFYPNISNQSDLFNLTNNNNDILLNKLDLTSLNENNLFTKLPKNILEIINSDKNDQAIISYHNDISSTNDYLLYNSKTNQPKKLNGNIKKIKWSKINNKIYYIYTNLNDSTSKIIWQFNTSDPDGSNWVNILSFENEVINNFWVSNSEKYCILSTVIENKVEIKYKYYLIDITNKTKKELANLDISSLYWSPNDQDIAFIDSTNNLKISDSAFSKINKTDLIINKDNIAWVENNSIFLTTINKTKSNKYTDYFDFYYLNTTNNKLKKIKLNKEAPINNVSQILTDINTKNMYYINNDNLYKINKPVINIGF